MAPVCQTSAPHNSFTMIQKSVNQGNTFAFSMRYERLFFCISTHGVENLPRGASVFESGIVSVLYGQNGQEILYIPATTKNWSIEQKCG